MIHRPAAVRRSGGAVVEFAAIAPFLLMLALGMVEMAQAMRIKQALSESARIAARTAALPNATTAEIVQDARASLDSNNIDGDLATVIVLVNDKKVEAKTAKQNDKVTVEISVPTRKLLWLSIFTSEKSVMSQSLVMMRQG